MQHLNDDMDEMFRKAADEYPLNSGTPDWSKIAAGLSQEKSPELPVKRSKRKYTWFLLLLPVGFISYQLYNPGLFKQLTNGNTVAVNKTNTQDQPVLKENGPGLDGQEQGLDSKEPGLDKSALDKSALDKSALDKSGLNKAGLEKAAPGKAATVKTGSANTGSAKTGSANTGSDKARPDKTGTDENKDKATQGLNAGVDGKTIPAETRFKSPGNGSSRINNTPGNNQKTINKKSPEPISYSLSGTTNAGTARNSSLDESTLTDFYLIDPYTKTGLVAFDITPDVSAIPEQEMTKLMPGPVSKRPVKNKNFYLGFAGGIDMTTVSLQQTSKIGNQFGGVAGYSFAKKWSVEVGFFVDKKYYYSDAKHFEKGKLPYRPNSTVLSVDGSCRMFEIPFSFKYDITNTYRSNFFVTGGLSSYIMKNEDYSILYLYNSSGSQAPHPYSYKNSSTNLFSQIRITGGYAIKLPKSFSVRIEPYFNIPVTGVGHGDLNLVSAGINAGIFRRIF